MPIIHGLADLFRHTNWADATVWNSALACANAENDERLRNLFYHIHTVQHVYFLIWLEKPVEIPDLSDFPNLLSLASWGFDYHQKAADYFDAIEEQNLERRPNIPWAHRIEELIGKPPAEATLHDTMLQVISHSAYHRGQVNTRLRELGEKPPLTDFIAWVWMGKPPAAWPEKIHRKEDEEK